MSSLADVHTTSSLRRLWVSPFWGGWTKRSLRSGGGSHPRFDRSWVVSASRFGPLTQPQYQGYNLGRVPPFSTAKRWVITVQAWVDGRVCVVADPPKVSGSVKEVSEEDRGGFDPRRGGALS